MRNSWRIAAVLLVSPVWAQPVGSSNEKLHRVGSRLACQCGCPHTVASCDMFECGFSSPAKKKITEMQASGVSDQNIIDQFVKAYGPQVYRGEPSVFGWLVPYLAIVPGLLLILLAIRYYRKPRPATAGGAPALSDADISRYHEQIEKDLSRLE